MKPNSILPIKYNGKTYISIADFIKDYKISRNVFNYRLNRGMSLKEIVSKPVRKSKSLVILGNKFSCISHACKFFNIDINTFLCRRRRGWSIKQALGISRKFNNSSCNGKIYIISNTVNNKKYIGITTQTLELRFYRHKIDSKNGSKTKLHKAMNELGINKFKIKLLQKAENKLELRNIENMYITRYNSIVNGYNTNKSGGSTTESVGIKIKYKNKNYPSIKALSLFLGVDNRTLIYRINKGLPLDSSSRNKRINYKNKWFDSVSSLAQFYGLHVNTVKYRIKNNISLQH